MIQRKLYPTIKIFGAITMKNDIKIQLRQAKKLYDSKKYEESLNLYEQLFNKNENDFTKRDLISYCWAIYQCHVKNFADENEIFEAVELITNLIPQSDLNHVNTCPYTFSVMKILDLLYEKNEYYNISYWSDKINPDLLDGKRNNYTGRVFRSMKEKYYDYVSKSHLECAEWELCIDICNEALNSLDEFTNNSDTWYRWRIAKSLKELHRNDEALEYLNEVLKVKKDWFVYREFAENYHILNEDEKALEYICGAILTNDPVNIKVNLYCLAYEILDELNQDIAFRHVELCYLLKIESGAQIPDELEDLMIDENEIDKNQLIDEINSYWADFKFKNQTLKYGTVTKYFEDKNFGFITDDNNESIFFHKNEFKGDNLYVGQLVSFYTEKSFDKSKNEESLKAVCIRGE